MIYQIIVTLNYYHPLFYSSCQFGNTLLLLLLEAKEEKKHNHHYENSNTTTNLKCIFNDRILSLVVTCQQYYRTLYRIAIFQNNKS